MDTCVCPSVHVWTETKKHTSYDHLCPSAHVWTVCSYKTPLLWLFFGTVGTFVAILFICSHTKPIATQEKKTPKFKDKSSHKTPFCPSVRPSVRPERFPGICRRMHGGIGLKFYMLMYLDHLQNWSVYGYGLLIFLILALFWLSETVQILGFRAFPGERMEEMDWHFARRCILTTFRTD